MIEDRETKYLSLSVRSACATIWLKGSKLELREINSFIREFTDLCADIDESPDIQCLVLRSSGSTFSCGFDFGLRENLLLEGGSDSQAGRLSPIDVRQVSSWEKAIVSVERMNKATIAVLHGHVVGPALQLALVCDHRIFRGHDGLISFPEVLEGFLPGMAMFRLAKYVGLGKAKKVLFTNERLRAEEACALGIVDVISDDVEAYLQRTLPDWSSPARVRAIIMARRLLLESYSMSYEDFIGNLLAAQAICRKVAD